MNKNFLQFGFTLVETLVAILILTMSISAMLNLAASSFFSVRYSRNDIVGNNLVQEAIEYIRNSRDTAYQNLPAGPNDWEQNLISNGCFNQDTGCSIDPYKKIISVCSSPCKNLSFFDRGTGNGVSFYGYSGSSYPISPASTGVPTTYIRTVKMTKTTNGYIVNVFLKWRNGLNEKSISQSITLTDWNL